MRKTLFVIFFLLVLSLLVVGCSKEEVVLDSTAGLSPVNDVSDNSDIYIDEQILDENETVEIGELI